MASYYRKRLSDRDFYLSQASRPLRPGKFSRFRGVTKGTPTHPYRVCLTHKGQRYYLGNFATELEAARVYNEAALRIIGDYALLNDLSAEG
jgi:hypothetical protein